LPLAFAWVQGKTTYDSPDLMPEKLKETQPLKA
jgi:hypothetical protein